MPLCAKIIVQEYQDNLDKVILSGVNGETSEVPSELFYKHWIPMGEEGFDLEGLNEIIEICGFLESKDGKKKAYVETLHNGFSFYAEGDVDGDEDSMVDNLTKQKEMLVGFLNSMC